MLTAREPTSARARHRHLRRGTVAVVATALLALAGCGGSGDPDGAAGGAAPTTVASEGPSTTTGTAPEGREDEVEPTDGIGEDDVFPELGNPDIDVEDYLLDLRYDPDTGELQGTATLAVTALDDLDVVELDFQGLTVDAVAVGGDDAAHEQDDDTLTVELGEPVDAGDELTVVVDYSGVPEPVATDALQGVEVGWHGGEGGSFVLSEPEGASTWYPVNNHPLDKATYTFRVTVPEPYTAIANGALVETEQDGDETTFEWRMDEPMASYLASVVTGDFYEVDGGEHDGVAYSYWYPAGTDPSRTLEQSDRVVAELAERLGPFPFATYGGVVYVPAFIDGDRGTERFLSNVAFEVQGRSLFALGTTVPSVVIHEAAHQWMGDSVSITDWSRDIWWVEGFARFAEFIDDPDQLEAMYPEVRANWIPPGDPPVDELFLGCSYECGAMVFYALYREVGEDTFWAILREFNDRYRYGNATTDDLIDVASEVSGTDLTDFFDAWLFDPTPPRLPS